MVFLISCSWTNGRVKDRLRHTGTKHAYNSDIEKYKYDYMNKQGGGEGSNAVW
jgi:hypothetical protein